MKTIHSSFLAFLTMIIIGTFMTGCDVGLIPTNKETEVVKPYVGGQITTSQFDDLISDMDNDMFVVVGQYSIYAWYEKTTLGKGFDISDLTLTEMDLSDIINRCEITENSNFFENFVKDYLRIYGVICVKRIAQETKSGEICYYLFWNNPEYMK